MKSRSLSAIASRRLALPLALGLAAAGLLLGAARAVRADIAPYPAQEGNSLGPASPTNIQMISETVLIRLVEITNTMGDTSYSVPGAQVVADFAMRNPGSAPQVLQVGFPMEVPKAAAQAGDYVKIKNLAAFVGAAVIETHAATVGNEIWSAWQMSFAPGDTIVRITYDLPVTIDACNAELGYVLHTGAAWAGPIGHADLIVRYPYAAEATFVGPKGIYLGDTTSGYQVEGTDLRWHYESIEPTAANDLAVTFVSPECWLKVAAARTALNQHATADNYWHLATAYADIVFPHHGFNSPLIAQVAEAQFQKALVLDPQNAAINAEYAQFLIAQVGYLLPAGRQSDEIKQCVKALPLAPHDDQLLWSCGPFLASHIGDPQVPAGLQATVAAVLTAVPQPTFPSTMTHVPATTATGSPTAAGTATTRPTIVASPSLTPVASLTSSPEPNATPTAVAVAQVATASSPIPTSAPTGQPSAGTAWIIGFIVLVGLILVAGLVYLRRPRGSRPA